MGHYASEVGYDQWPKWKLEMDKQKKARIEAAILKWRETKEVES